jgi:hypothetical protein
MKKFCQCGRHIQGRSAGGLCDICKIKIYQQRKNMITFLQDEEPKEETPEETPSTEKQPEDEEV